MKTLQLEESAIDQILWLLAGDESRYALESGKIAQKIYEQCEDQPQDSALITQC